MLGAVCHGTEGKLNLSMLVIWLVVNVALFSQCIDLHGMKRFYRRNVVYFVLITSF